MGYAATIPPWWAHTLLAFTPTWLSRSASYCTYVKSYLTYSSSAQAFAPSYCTVVVPRTSYLVTHERQDHQTACPPPLVSSRSIYKPPYSVGTALSRSRVRRFILLFTRTCGVCRVPIYQEGQNFAVVCCAAAPLRKATYLRTE
jgi:hypothetical protein